MDVLQWSRHYRCFPGQGGFDLAALPGRGPATPATPGRSRSRSSTTSSARPTPTAWPSTRCARCCSSRRPRTRARGRARRSPARDVAGALPTRPPCAATPSSSSRSTPRRSARPRACCTRSASRRRPAPHQAGHALASRRRPRAAQRRRAAGPRGIAAIAVESADPPARRGAAEALLAPILARQRGPGEADLAAVAAPDGTAVFFCRTDAAEPRAGCADFAPLAGRTAADGAALVSGIDHVALSQPFDSFDEAVLFYRSVLGLEPRESLELAAPDGLVRSRAVSSADGSVRLALNVPVLGRRRRRRACSTSRSPRDDALAAARRLRRARRRAARDPRRTTTTTSPPARARARAPADACASSASSTTATRAASSCTSTRRRSAARLFFEVVERRGGYDGYGAANAPVRMAAQRRPHAVATTSSSQGGEP